MRIRKDFPCSFTNILCFLLSSQLCYCTKGKFLLTIYTTISTYCTGLTNLIYWHTVHYWGTIRWTGIITYFRCKSLQLCNPVWNSWQWCTDEKWSFNTISHQMTYEGNALNSLAKAHFISQNSIDSILIQHLQAQTLKWYNVHNSGSVKYELAKRNLTWRTCSTGVTSKTIS